MATSDIPQIDLEATLAQLARDRAETQKLSEETRKFVTEQHKLLHEGDKFRAETAKLWRDWQLAPWALALGAISGLIAGLIVKHL